MDAGKAVRREKVDSLEYFQGMYGLFQSGVHLRQAAVGVGPYGQGSCGLRLRLMLRKVDGAYRFSLN
jgi:hypothetical protein